MVLRLRRAGAMSAGTLCVREAVFYRPFTTKHFPDSCRWSPRSAPVRSWSSVWQPLLCQSLVDSQYNLFTSLSKYKPLIKIFNHVSLGTSDYFCLVNFYIKYAR